MTPRRARFACAYMFGLSASAACAVTHAQTLHLSEFEIDFDGWQQQWHKESETGTDGVATHTTDRGYLDNTSLKFDMGDGFGDDGTLWIERMLPIDPGVPTRVAMAFHVFNEFQSDFNAFQVKAAISNDDPTVQADFTTIGSTDTAEGWVLFTFDRNIVSPTGQVWVTLGIRVAFETHRDYWINHVVVTTVPIPEPNTAILLSVALLCFIFSSTIRGIRTAATACR